MYRHSPVNLAPSLTLLSRSGECSDRELRQAHPAKGCLLGSHKVGHRAVQQPDDHMDGADCVGEGKVVEDGLIQQVEGHIQAVPHHHKQQRGQLRCCLHSHHLCQSTASNQSSLSSGYLCIYKSRSPLQAVLCHKGTDFGPGQEHAGMICLMPSCEGFLFPKASSSLGCVHMQVMCICV